MKNLMLVMMILSGVFGASFTQAQEEIPDAVYVALEHLNEYLLIPIELYTDGVEWDWEIVTLTDFGENCRERQDTRAFLPDIAYDIRFNRLTESYHYRVSMDEQLVVPCIAPVDIPADTLPALSDALADLNRRFHVSLTLNDLPWKWEETQFNDYTLGCPKLIPPEDEFDQRIDAYIIEFRLLGQEWVYHVSSDRLIVLLCNEEDE